MKTHVTEDTLAAIAAFGDGDLAEDSRAHLATCPECAERLSAMTALASEFRTTAFDEADEVFDENRLARQRDHILRRIEHAGRPARVIEFPHRAAGTRPVRPSAVRWVAAAAAAGLVIGVYAGSHLNNVGQGVGSGTPIARMTVPASAQPDHATGRDVTLAADEEILSEIETALVSQGSPELQAIDALTPRFREVGLRIR